MTDETKLEELAMEVITLCNSWDANPHLKEWKFPQRITRDLATFALTFSKDPKEYYKKIPGLEMLESENNNVTEVFETLYHSKDPFIKSYFSVPHIIQIVKKCRRFYHPIDQAILISSLKSFYQFFSLLGHWMIQSFEDTESYEKQHQLLKDSLTLIRKYIDF